MLTKYRRSDMVYADYKWIAEEDHDNPKIIHGTDAAQLNRLEGYEMLYFINSLAKSWGWDGYPLTAYNNLEKEIKSKVPSSIRTHSGIKDWLEKNYN